MRKGRLAVVTVFGSLAVGLAACTVLSGRVYNSVLYDIVPWLVTGMVCVIPTVLCGKLETPRLSKCRNGCMQLFVFCVSTVLTIYIPFYVWQKFFRLNIYRQMGKCGYFIY